MNKRYALLLIPAFALGACSTNGYDVTPVVGPNDTRHTDAPDLSEEDAVDKQRCFEVSLWNEDGLIGYEEETVGIACIQDTDNNKDN